MKVFTDNEAKLVRLLAECFIPRGGGMIADGVDANVVDFLDNWMSQLPPSELLKARALFNLFEYWVAVERMRPMARFTRLSPDERMAYLSQWEHSSVYARRLAFQGIRSMITIAYCESGKVRDEMGLPETNRELHGHLRKLSEAATLLGV